MKIDGWVYTYRMRHVRMARAVFPPTEAQANAFSLFMDLNTSRRRSSNQHGQYPFTVGPIVAYDWRTR